MIRKRTITPFVLVPTLIATTAFFPLHSLAEESDTTKPTRAEYHELLNARLTQAAEKKQLAEERAEQIRQNMQERQSQAQERAEQSIENTKQRLTTQIDRTLTHFQTIIDRINASRGLSDTSKAAAIAEVESYMVQILNIKTLIENAQTVEELKEISMDAKELWQGYNQQHLGYIGLHMVGRFQDYLDRISLTSDRLQAHMEFLSTTYPDINLTEVKSALNSFEIALSGAQENVSNAEVLFGSINANNENNRDLYKQGMAELKEAKETIHIAHAALRDAVVDAKQAVSELKETTREE